jgi:hypothetical protein
VKADQLDDSSVWQELDEFVITKELDITSASSSAVSGSRRQGGNPDPVTGKMGVWISGFFGSGKSHFLKILSYLLEQPERTTNGQTRQAVEFFESKIKDAMLFGDIKRAVAPTPMSSCSTSTARPTAARARRHPAGLPQGLQRDAGLQRRPSAHRPHGALPRIQGQARGLPRRLPKPHRQRWEQERDAYSSTGMRWSRRSQRSPRARAKRRRRAWIDKAEDNFRPDGRELRKWVKEYLDSKGARSTASCSWWMSRPVHRQRHHLMLNLQTITEDLGTICGRAWVVVTSQEDIDAVLGEVSKCAKANDFSKIQGRFKTRLSLSSANVDEVIQARLLAKPAMPDELGNLCHAEKGDILKNQLSFRTRHDLQALQGREDFVKNYPFAPYQFQLVQKIFEAIRKAGATGLHLARGERSMLDAFQSAAKSNAQKRSACWSRCTTSTRPSRASSTRIVKKTIDQAAETTPAWSRSTSNCSSRFCS